MTDRPIIFSGPMVRALLDGRKTQTRRLATSPLRHCQVGDRLYVRESFGCKLWDYPGVKDGRQPEPGDPVMFMADPENAHWGAGLPSQGGFVWRPSIHMPRWASRLTLTVKDVRLQRLNEIQTADIYAEGAAPRPDMIRCLGSEVTIRQNAVNAWRKLWNSLHDKPGERWEDNPEIVALTFTVARRNIDEATGGAP